MKKALAFCLILALCFGTAVTLGAADPATLTVSSATASAGKTVSLTVTLSGAPAAKDLCIVPVYDTAKLEMISGTWLLTDATLADDWSEDFGDAVCTYSGDTDINGVIFEMVFKVKQGASGTAAVTLDGETAVKTSTQDVSSGGIALNLVGGTVTVAETIPQKFEEQVSLDTADEFAQGAGKGMSFGIAGVQIRTKVPSGLRYVARMSADLLTELQTEYGADNVSYGILLQKESAVDADLTEEDLTVGKSLSNGGAIAVNGQFLYQTYEGYFYFTAAVCGIPEADWQTDIVARAYVKCGDAYYFATETAGMIYDVAGAEAVAGGYSVSLYHVAAALQSDPAVAALYPIAG